MITLIQAIKLLDIKDDEIINFSTKSHHKISNPWANVGLLRKSVDMRRIDIRKIGTDYYPCSPDINWEFVVSEKDWTYLKGVLIKY